MYNFFILFANTHTHAMTVEHIMIGLSIGLVLVGVTVVLMRRHISQAKQKVDGSMGNLQAEKTKSSLILNAIEDGVIVTDNQGIIRLCNPAAAALTGWNVEDTSGLDVHAVLQFADEKGIPVEKPRNPISQALKASEHIRDSNIMLTSKTGSNQFISISVSPIKNDDGQLTGVVAVFQDISKEKTEEQRRVDFISTASHEMRTPVAAIEGYLALAMNDKVTSIDAKARSYLEKAHASTQHLGKLFQDLLTSAKAEDGRLVSHPVVVELSEYLEQLVDSLRFSADKKGLQMQFSIGVSEQGGNTSSTRVIKPLYYVLVDPDRLREAITNLFDNAVKYTPSGRITIGLTGNNDVVQFFIRDTGPGIPPEDLKHLFQKFYRVDNSVTRTVGGTGLGLFISRKIIELYKGRIWVESELEKGSTFYINLPRLSAQKAAEIQKQEVVHSANASPLDR